MVLHFFAGKEGQLIKGGKHKHLNGQLHVIIFYEHKPVCLKDISLRKKKLHLYLLNGCLYIFIYHYVLGRLNYCVTIRDAQGYSWCARVPVVHHKTPMN